MNYHLFSYREQFSFAPPYQGEIQTVWEQAKKVVVEVNCLEDGHSAFLVHRNVAVSILPDDFHPTHITFPDGTKQEVIGVRNICDFHFLVFENSREKLQVETDLNYNAGRFVFQVGLENSLPFNISFCEITRIKSHKEKYKYNLKEQEVGSAIFSRQGKLMGLTIGHAGDDWVACSILDVWCVFEELRNQMKK
jgi:hypothetical protein